MSRARGEASGDAPALTAAAAFNNDYEQLPEEGDDQERAAREWLRHVEAGRIG